MKNVKLIALGIIMFGVIVTAAQERGATSTNMLGLWKASAYSIETSIKAREQGDRIAAAADYLKLALVLGLGMLIGRMSAVSHRELTEMKATLARLAGSNSQ